MKKLLEGFTKQLSEALKLGETVDMVRPGTDIRNVLISGVGGSGVAANLIESLTYSRIPIPIVVNKGYTLPQFVGPNTLFIACSYSGNTEETLAAVHTAILKRANIVCITSGGQLLALAKEHNYYHLRLPEGYTSPRSLIGYMLIAQLFVLYHTNLIGAAFIKETENAITYLDRGEKAIQSQAELIARKLRGKIPFIYCDARLAAMGLRFQQQLNENSKQIAHLNTFPELNHTEMEGWEFPATAIQQVQVLYLYSDHDHERNEKMMEICRPIFERRSHPVIDIVAEGASLLEQYYYLIHLTDWISYFLAKENQVDPDPVATTTFVNAELNKPK